MDQKIKLPMKQKDQLSEKLNLSENVEDGEWISTWSTNWVSILDTTHCSSPINNEKFVKINQKIQDLDDPEDPNSEEIEKQDLFIMKNNRKIFIWNFD